MKLLSSQIIHKDFVNVRTLHLECWNNFIDLLLGLSTQLPEILGYDSSRFSGICISFSILGNIEGAIDNQWRLYGKWMQKVSPLISQNRSQ